MCEHTRAHLYPQECQHVRAMQKRLTRTGNSHVIVLDQGILEATGVDRDTLLEASPDGDVILTCLKRSEERATKLKRGLDRMHERYAGAFRLLAQ